MDPICQVAGFMEREYGLPNVASRKKGLQYGDTCWYNYSVEVHQLIQAWNPAADLAPMDLRNCLK